MARVKRGVQAHARHKKIVKLAKDIRVGEKMYSELQNKRLLRQANMLTGIESSVRGSLECFGLLV